MKFNHEGLSLWYGTPDAPAPFDLEVMPRKGTSLVAGVHPANPSNAVNVRYRVDGGHVQIAPGRELRVDYARDCQYFVVPFPSFPVGNRVEYAPMLSCAGRQVPPPRLAERFPSTFLLEPTESPAAKATAKAASLLCSDQRYAADVSFLLAVTVHVDTPQFIGETPQGVRIDFYVREGTAIGPGIRGKVLPGSNDHMFVRPDGIGVVRVRAAIETDDGAMFEIEEKGNIDFGEDGYRKAAANALPIRSPMVVTPRILTGHPKYRWLNRVQCLGVGSSRLDENIVEYDLFSVMPRALSNPA